jgi:hypothetical protein
VGIVGDKRATVEPIARDDIPEAAGFLHSTLNPRVSAASWAHLLDPPWHSVPAPNSGFRLMVDGRVAGVYAAVYSERQWGDARRMVCNLAAFCVEEDQRAHSLRLVRALLKQEGMVFTDLSPSGNVVAMNERLGFRRLDTATTVVVNAPRLPKRGMVITSRPDALDETLRGADAAIHRDHRDAAAARHLLVRTAGSHAYLVYRRDRRKRLPLFASPLYAGGDRELLEAAWPSVAGHLLAEGLPLTLGERRILGFTPPGAGRDMRNPRPKMVRGDDVDIAAIDYLYSELALVQW